MHSPNSGLARHFRQMPDGSMAWLMEMDAMSR